MAGYILVVDDDAGLREALALELESLGYRTGSAANGAEALERVHAELPMLVLTDLEMPEMNGRQLLQRLRGEPLGSDVPVVVLSAFGFEWEADLMGAQAFVRKPVNSAQLRETLSNVLMASGAPTAPELRH
jgi:CheY-like chemotaxis protein